jgi:thioredoxin 1
LALLADIRTREELHAVLDAPGLTILDVYTQDCVICRKIEPMVAAVAQTSRGVQARKVDAAALPEFAERYEVRGVPTLLLFRNGRAIDRRSGFFTATDLREWLRAKESA